MLATTDPAEVPTTAVGGIECQPPFSQGVEIGHLPGDEEEAAAAQAQPAPQAIAVACLEALGKRDVERARPVGSRAHGRDFTGWPFTGWPFWCGALAPWAVVPRRGGHGGPTVRAIPARYGRLLSLGPSVRTSGPRGRRG